MRNTQNNNGGIGFIGLLTIVFVFAKLIGWISWSWWWVFSPIWIGFGLLVILVTLLVLLGHGDYFDYR